MTKRKQLEERYKVALWKEYIPHFKQMAWVCLIDYDFDKVFIRKTLKEVEAVLSRR
ncbi:hypothetical protein ACQPUY_16945 [Clostridium nigeriense]|uniref:hypothetical protein n=1 Tax=Clostridium nigeriense TaxID=1805470 RepID=UPI003D341B96